MKPSVCIISSVHPALDTRIFHKEASSLAPYYEVSLIARHERPERLHDVDIIPLPAKKNRLLRLANLWSLYKMAARRKANIYHLHDPELLPIGLLLKLSTGAKIIYDIHEDVRRQILQKHWIPRPFRRLLSLAYGLVEISCLRFFDALIVVVEPFRKLYRRYDNVTLVRNYPLLNRFPAHVAGRPERLASGNVKKRLIYVGGLTEQRGTLKILEAMALINRPEVEVLLVGPIFSLKLQAELTKLIDRHHLTDRVTQTGRLPFDEAQALVGESDIGLVVLKPIANYVESLPTKLFEYMWAGVPVVASNFPLWKEIVEGSECGLVVDPLDEQAIAKAIMWLLDHPDEAAKMGENGKKAVLRQYNWKNEEKKLFDLYDMLIGQPYDRFTDKTADPREPIGI